MLKKPGVKKEVEKWFKLSKKMKYCGLHFDIILWINYEKYDEKCYDQSILWNTYNH